MADATTYVAKYLRAVAEPLRADGWELADDAVFEGYGTNRADIEKAIQADIDAGLAVHNPIATAAAGDFLVALAELRWADGTTRIAAGAVRFNEAGLMTEIVGRVPPEDQAAAGQAPKGQATRPATAAVSYVGRWLHAVDAFNQGDMATFGAALADDCTFDVTGGSPGGGLDAVTHVGDTKLEILKFIQQRRDDGWVAHDVIGTAAAGEFLVSVFENRYADGTGGIGAGIGRFNDEGLITELRALNPES